NGSPAHEDFTHIVGNMEQGESYPIALEGNTAGNWVNRFVVFIDWNQNGILNDAGEVYEMNNTIQNSNGTDGQQALGTISVPADAELGETRMRVKKIFGTTDFLNPCLGADFGQAEDYTINVNGGLPFPEPYCGPLVFTFDIEPISRVDVADIDNLSDPTVNGSPAHEDFTHIVGNMEQGESYPIALEGNTAGNWVNRFVVFIDWNQNGILNDAGEVYEMNNTIQNSNGTDGQQALGTISVPADAELGETRMRVKKIFGTTDFLNPCLGADFGQAEDYTINVNGGLPFPEPYCGPLVFTFDIEPISRVDVADIDNLSDPTVNGSPAHEDFTHIVGNMEQGESYPIALEGNTAGNWVNRFVVFIDWNQNGILNDAGEVYEMNNTIQNSNGTDGQQALGTISVPADAELGETRMRVKKIFGTTDFLNPCL